MKEQEWGDELKRELNAIHAPQELIHLTKQKTLKEKQRIDRMKSTKSRFIYGISGLGAVAAIFVLVILSSFYMSRSNAYDDIGTKLLLGEKNGQEIYLYDQVEIERTSVLPMEYMQGDVWEEEIENILFKLTCNKDGYFMAAYEEDSTYIIIYSKEKDMNKFIAILNDMLNDERRLSENR